MTGSDPSRRQWLRRFALAGAGVVLLPATGRPQSPGLVEMLERGYRFLPGGAVFAGGAVALPGFEIEHAVFQPWLPLAEAYVRIESHLAALGRPMQALCGMELRLPRQLTPEEFQVFNAPYVERLVRWGLMAEGRNPVARTNVAPALEPPEFPSVHGFSYTVPGPAPGNFVMAGMTENAPNGIVAPGDTSAAGLREKVTYVVRTVTRRLEQLGVSFRDASHVEFYAAARGTETLLAELVVPGVGDAAHRGVRWHYGRPPVQGLEIELEARRVAREVVLY